MSEQDEAALERVREHRAALRNLAGEIMLRCGVRGMSKAHGEMQDWIEGALVALVFSGQVAEREECARLADKRAVQQRKEAMRAYQPEPGGGCDADMFDADAMGAEALAKQIRARGEKRHG